MAMWKMLLSASVSPWERSPASSIATSKPQLDDHACNVHVHIKSGVPAGRAPVTLYILHLFQQAASSVQPPINRAEVSNYALPSGCRPPIHAGDDATEEIASPGGGGPSMQTPAFRQGQLPEGRGA
jgi:hypothetical protein